MTDPLVGQELGRYQIDARLGAGGMGVVYRAHDRVLQRPVAIKMLGGGPDPGGRLLHEARSASALNHPNICTVHEVGEHEGQPFIVMELVEGEPLSAHVTRGPMPAGEVLRIAEQVADALAHAHGRGVIHRDLKCANVVAGADGRVKVLDFGIAVRPVAGSAETITGPEDPRGTVTGTVAYMAPEVLRGEPADQQSEIWSVGVMLFELTAARRPFEGDSPFALVAAIVSQPPRPLPPTTPASLQSIIQRCLARERHERYQSARELRVAAETARQALSSGRQIAIDPTAAPRQITSLAVLPLLNRCAEAGQDFFVDGMTDALIAELSRLHALRVISRTSMMRYRDTTKTIPEIAMELGVDAIVEGSVMTAKGVVRVQAQLIDGASDRSLWSRSYDRPADDVLALHSDVAAAIAEDIRLRITPEERARLNAVRHVNPAAHEAWLRGRYLQNKTVWTPADYEQALTHYQQSAEIDPEYAPAFVGIADIYHRLGGYGIRPPKEAFALAKVAAERALALDDTLSDSHSAVAFSKWLNDWDYAGAAVAYERALELGSTQAIHEHASLLSLLRRHEEAVSRYLHALSISPYNSDVHWGLGMVYRQGGWPERGVEALRAWLRVEPHDVHSNFQLALTLAGMSQFDEAAAILNQLAAIPPVRPLALGPLAYVRGRAGERDEAALLIQELAAIAAAGFPVHGWLSIGYLGVGDHEKALDAMQAAVDAHDSWMPTNMHVEPVFRPLHGHPRFEHLLRITGHDA